MKSRPMLAFALALLIMPTHCQEDNEGEAPSAGEAPPEPNQGEAFQGLSISAEQLTRLHSKLDSDGDGKVSLKEMLAHPDVVGKAIAIKGASEIFQEMDKSGDAKLSLDEYLADQPQANLDDYGPEHRKEMEQLNLLETAKFKAADTDGDHFLDTAELAGLLYPHTHDGVLHVTVSDSMRRKDNNTDGTLTKHEFWEPAPDDDGKPGTLTDDEHKEFEKLDRNSDGAIDLEEMKAWESGRYHAEQAIRKFFEVADINKDTHITPEEMAVARDKLGDSDALNFFSEWVDHYEL